MYEELLKKLRHCNDEIFCSKCDYTWDCEGEKTIIGEAADAIEELQKQLREEKVANVNLTGWLAEEHANKCPHYIRNIQYIGNGSLCDKWECKIASLPKWIPVTERLPEQWKRVLTYQEDYGVTENNICGDGINWRIGYHITHWMPLPEPPESEGE